MKSTKRKCDSPKCDTEALPEQIKPYIMPYRWLGGRITWMGEGRYTVEVCSPECLGPAIHEACDGW